MWVLNTLEIRFFRFCPEKESLPFLRKIVNIPCMRDCSEAPAKMSTDCPKTHFHGTVKKIKKLSDYNSKLESKKWWLWLKRDVGWKSHEDFAGRLFERWKSGDNFVNIDMHYSCLEHLAHISRPLYKPSTEIYRVDSV